MADQTKSLTALSQALKLEQQGRDFYLKAAEETLDERGKRMFLSLADDERIHAEMVLRQLHALEGEGIYVLLPELNAPAIDLTTQLFPPDREKRQAKIGLNPNDIDVLHVALETEVKSYDLYRAASQTTDDPAGRQMYRWLAAAEITHFNLLMSNYEAIVEGGSWV